MYEFHAWVGLSDSTYESDGNRVGTVVSQLTDLIGDSGFDHEGDSLPLSVAIGVTMIADADSAAEVMARADEEMYRAKAA